MRILYKYFSIVLLVVLGCGEDDLIRPSDAEYFPLRKGFYQVYSVHKTRYQLMDKIEDFTYELKTEVVDSFMNQQGVYTYTIHRSTRSTSADAWEFQQVWSVRLTPTNMVVYEENIPYIKIAFPAKRSRQWDGNALNNLAADEYEVSKTGKSYKLETGETAGHYIQIVQEDSYDPVTFKNKRQEFYVQHVGLVYSEIIDLEYCSRQGDCEIGTQVIENGTINVQTLTGYGQN